MCPPSTPPPELGAACPKCKAPAGQPCRSVIHGGPLECKVYRTHKKRRRAWLLGTLVLGGVAFPARPARRTGPQVGLVDSAARGLR